MYAERSNNSSQNMSAKQNGSMRRCANCDIVFPWSVVLVDGRTYCCTGCAAGGPCNCDYSQYRSVTIAGVIHYDMYENEAAPSVSDEVRGQQ